jgi:hypothetical protein
VPPKAAPPDLDRTFRAVVAQFIERYAKRHNKHWAEAEPVLLARATNAPRATASAPLDVDEQQTRRPRLLLIR